MAWARVIEQESGTSHGVQHPHNGYYAGDFSNVPFRAPELPPSPRALQVPNRPVEGGCHSLQALTAGQSKPQTSRSSS